MTRTSKYLNQDTIAALQSFQIEKIDCEITDYLDTNNKMNTYHFEYCPKCGCYHPRLIKSGFANSGKQINVNERNVFNMRHKLLVSLGTEERPIHGR